MQVARATHRWWIFLSIITFAYFASVVFIPLVLAVFFAMLLWPSVEWSCARGMPRAIASLGVTFLTLAFLGLAGWIVLSSAMDIAANLPQYAEKITSLLGRLREYTSAIELKTSTIFGGAAPTTPVQKVELIQHVPSWSGYLFSSAGMLTEFLTLALFVPLMLLYIFLDKENLVESADTLLGKYAYLPKLHAELPRMVRAFVVGNIAAGLFLIVSQGAVLYFLGYSNWMSLAVVSGMLNLLPIFGAPLAILFPLGQAIIQFQTFSPVVAMIVAIVTLHFFANNILLPQVVGSRVNINSISMIVGLLFWSWLWGAGGFLLAIPMTALVKIFLESHPDTLPIANLMATRPKRLVLSNRRLSGVS